MNRVHVPLLATGAALLLIGVGVFALSVQADSSVFAARAGEDMLVECAGPEGALVALDGSASTASGENDTLISYEWREGERVLGNTSALAVTLPVGEHVLTLTVMNSTNDTRADNVTVVVADTQAPTLIATLLDNGTLWPPNHKLRELDVDVDVSDVCTPDTTFRLVSVTSDEPDDGRGDGHTSGDVQDADVGTSDTSVTLRAERAGPGDGRTYTLLYEATDAAGNVAQASVLVIVPHDVE